MTFTWSRNASCNTLGASSYKNIMCEIFCRLVHSSSSLFCIQITHFWIGYAIVWKYFVVKKFCGWWNPRKFITRKIFTWIIKIMKFIYIYNSNYCAWYTRWYTFPPLPITGILVVHIFLSTCWIFYDCYSTLISRESLWLSSA